jgi:beta-phosphoglucomutase-like phosphatase (HAD superfamily)
VVRAVVFDLDGVLLDSEGRWDQARRQVTSEHGGRWRVGATEAMQGMSSLEWSRYLADGLGVQLTPKEIADRVVVKLLGGYRNDLPLIPGAVEAVRRTAARWPLGLASSANRSVIDEVLTLASLGDAFMVTVSSEEVARGKPAPDVYLEAAHRLAVPAEACAAVEDSANGIRSAAAAGMQVVAVPNPDFPPLERVLARATLVIAGLDELTVEALDALRAHR